jgi:hypothetical protein
LMRKSWVIYQKSTMMKITGNKQSWIYKNNLKRCKMKMAKVRRAKLKDLMRWSSWRWLKRSKFKKIWTMHTNLLTNLKIKIQIILQLIVMKSKSKRTNRNTKKGNKMNYTTNRSHEKFMAQTNPITKKEVAINQKDSSSRKISTKHWWTIMLMNWQKV